MNPILYRNHVICYLKESELDALSVLAPYWGLLFNKQELFIEPGLSSQTICIKNMQKKDQDHLADILSHTHIHFVESESESDLLLEISESNQRYLPPISLASGNLTYRLKYANNIGRDLQRMIHQNIWLPVRHPLLSLTFNNVGLDEQKEIISYLVIQFFLRDQMKPISHVSFEVYSSLIEKVMRPINPNFSLLQEKLNKKFWPEIPPEIARNQEEQNQSIDRHFLPEQKPTPFNPFKNHSPSQSKQINPFQSTKNKQSSTINPFKRKT